METLLGEHLDPKLLANYYAL